MPLNPSPKASGKKRNLTALQKLVDVRKLYTQHSGLDVKLSFSPPSGQFSFSKDFQIKPNAYFERNECLSRVEATQAPAGDAAGHCHAASNAFHFSIPKCCQNTMSQPSRRRERRGRVGSNDDVLAAATQVRVAILQLDYCKFHYLSAQDTNAGARRGLAQGSGVSNQTRLRVKYLWVIKKMFI